MCLTSAIVAVFVIPSSSIENSPITTAFVPMVETILDPLEHGLGKICSPFRNTKTDVLGIEV
jgi:hypothetical protein